MEKLPGTVGAGLGFYLLVLDKEQQVCRNLWNGSQVIPHSWYHICVGIDTVSGLLRVVDNGVLVLEEEVEMLKNTSSIKPNDVEGRLLGKLDELIL